MAQSGPCSQYKVDLTASFGTCTCGFKKSDHGKPSLHMRFDTRKPVVTATAAPRSTHVAPPKPVTSVKQKQAQQASFVPTDTTAKSAASFPKAHQAKPKKDTKKACSNYQVDLTAAAFAQCKCGFPKKDHAISAESRKRSTFTIPSSKPFHQHSNPSVPKQEIKPVYKQEAKPVKKLPEKKADEPNVTSTAKTVNVTAAVKASSPVQTASNLPTTTSNTSSSMYKALYEFSSSKPGDLSFHAGEVIKVIEKQEGGWWKGRNEKGTTGTFPMDYVQETSASFGTHTNDLPSKAESKVSVSKQADSDLPKISQNNMSTPSSQGIKPTLEEDQRSKAHSSVAQISQGFAARQKAQLNKQGDKSKPNQAQKKSSNNVRALSQKFANMDVPVGNKPPVGQKSISSKTPATTNESESSQTQRKPSNVRALSQKFAQLNVPVGPLAAKAKQVTTSQTEQSTSKKRYRGLYDFDGDRGAGDLPFKQGDIVEHVRQVDENWVECKDSAGAVGICPTDYLEEVLYPDISKTSVPSAAVPSYSKPTTVNTGTDSLEASVKNETFVKSTFDFPAQQDGDISFNVNDIILILDDIDENWYSGHVISDGKNLNKSGLFPKTFVEPISITNIPQSALKHAAALRNKASVNPFLDDKPPAAPPRDDQAPVPPPRDDDPFQHTAPPQPPPRDISQPVTPPREPVPVITPGRTEVRVARVFQSNGAAKPPEPWYCNGDTYSCKISLQTRGTAKTKIETFNINKQDRSEIVLEITQKSNESSANVIANVTLFEPFPNTVLDASAAWFGPKIVSYAESKMGTRDGNGECWTLADNALKHVGTQHAIGFNFGQEIPLDQVLPGDILQFKTCKFTFPGGSKTAGAPDHTAVVRRRISGTSFEVLEQNPKPVHTGNYDFSQLTGGSCKAFRPIPKKEEIDSIQRQVLAQNAAPSPPAPRNANANMHRVRALYDFTAQEPGDLSFRENDVIVVTGEDGDWSQGYIEGQSSRAVGQFPTNYTQKL